MVFCFANANFDCQEWSGNTNSTVGFCTTRSSLSVVVVVVVVVMASGGGGGDGDGLQHF